MGGRGISSALSWSVLIFSRCCHLSAERVCVFLYVVNTAIQPIPCPSEVTGCPWQSSARLPVG